MRIIATSDLHGSVPHYEALAALVATEQPAALLLAGDLLAPLTDPETALPTQRSFVRMVLRPWLDHLHSIAPNCRVYAIPGNWDYCTHDADFQAFDADGCWVWIHQRSVRVAANWWITGLGDVPITPFPPKDRDRRDEVKSTTMLPYLAVVSAGDRLRPAVPDEVRQHPTLADELLQLVRLSPPAQTLYVLHAPPANTALDLTSGRMHVGSWAVRRFIEHYQPPVTVHGHIHESPEVSGAASEQLGRTLALNAGQRSDALCVLLFDLDDPAHILQHRVIPVNDF